jgi:hypothetical protein
MSRPPGPAPAPPLPPHEGRLVDEVCDRFEQGWRGGLRPPIEHYLGRAPDSARTALLRELLALELVYRRQAGEQPSADEYVGRFPDHAGLIACAFREATPAPRLPPSPCPGGWPAPWASPRPPRPRTPPRRPAGPPNHSPTSRR